MQNQTQSHIHNIWLGCPSFFLENLSQSRLSSCVNWFGNVKPSSEFRCSGCHVSGCQSAVAGKEENWVAHTASKGQPYMWGSYWSKVKVNVACKQQLETPSSCFYCLLNGQVNCQDVVFPTVLWCEGKWKAGVFQSAVCLPLFQSVPQCCEN